MDSAYRSVVISFFPFLALMDVKSNQEEQSNPHMLKLFFALNIVFNSQKKMNAFTNFA